MPVTKVSANGDFVNPLDRGVQKTHGGSEHQKQSQPRITRTGCLPVISSAATSPKAIPATLENHGLARLLKIPRINRSKCYA